MYNLKVLSDKVDSLFRKIRMLYLPSKEGNAGKVLTTDGTSLIWGVVSSSGGTRDLVPTDGSTNSVESNGVYDALQLKVDKTGSSDIEITDATKGIILRTVGGVRARVTLVSNSGNLTLQISNAL